MMKKGQKKYTKMIYLIYNSANYFSAKIGFEDSRGQKIPVYGTQFFLEP